MNTTHLLAALGSAAFVTGAANAESVQPAAVHREALRTPPKSPQALPGRFVISLKPRVDPRAVARDYGVKPDFVYTRVLNGFAGTIAEAARSGLLRDSRIVRIEPDRPVHATTTTTSWGLDRIDQRSQPLNAQYVAPRTGRGVTLYIVDSGIRFDHQLFGGRAVPGIDTVGDGRNGNDCDGHGTHVAGIAAGASGYGVAPGARLVSARVLDCEGSGTTSGVIAALDWIAANGARPGVVNMSLGGDPHSAMEDAVRRLIASGFPVVVAAGNSNADACRYSPSRIGEAVTIGATTKLDSRASFSNYGSCVDMFAPGEAITSAWVTGGTALAVSSGTSMAAPHVAGSAALVLEASPQIGPQAVRDSIYQMATRGIVTAAASANNHLLFVGSEAAAPSSGSATTSGGTTINGTSGNDVINRSSAPPGQPRPTDSAETINGLGGHDNISGEGGNDTINGGDGTDTLNGGPGDDRLDGGNGNDWVSYVGAPAAVKVNLATTSPQATGGGGTDTLIGIEYAVGSYHADNLAGNGAANTLVGSVGSDILNGAAGNDDINGGTSNDQLTGGTGQDKFRFDSALSATTNVDRIVDYSVADDSFWLARRIFAAIPASGTLPAAAFRSGTAAADADDRIIHDRSTGRILYDADGSGPGAAVPFAQVAAGLVLTNAEFIAY